MSVLTGGPVCIKGWGCGGPVCIKEWGCCGAVSVLTGGAVVGLCLY